MLEDIKSGKINCIIVKDLSRLGREYNETFTYLRRVFPALGVRFIAINDNIDTAKETVTGDISVSFKGVMNDEYCRDISVKVRTALNIKRKNGDFVGAVPVYGYKKADDNKNQLVIDEYAAQVVKDIFKMRTDGYSAERIATELNRLAVLSPMEYKKDNNISLPTGGYCDKENSKWSATTVIRIFKDEIYTGKLIQGKCGKPNYKVKEYVKRNADEMFVTENAHEAIIGKQDFELVQKIMRIDTRTSPKKNELHLFSGILICGCCGNRMTCKTVTHNGEKYFYYYCPTGKKHGCTGGNMIKETDLVNCVTDSIKGHIRNVASLNALIPIVKFLLGVSNVSVPWETLILSVILFVVIPLAGGMLTRYLVTKKKGKDYFEKTFVKKFDGITTIGLLLTLIMIFSFQENVILENPLHIVLIAVPLILQTFLIFAIAYGTCKLLKLPHKIAAPAGMISASNFFEFAVAVAVALFGTTSPAALATTVGVLTEVPVMLFLVKVANSTKGWFKNG